HLKSSAVANDDASFSRRENGVGESDIEALGKTDVAQVDTLRADILQFEILELILVREAGGDFGSARPGRREHDFDDADRRGGGGWGGERGTLVALHCVPLSLQRRA